MILLAVIVAILIPTCTSIKYRNKYEALLVEYDTLKETQLRVIEENNRIEAERPEYQSKYPDFYAPQEVNATEILEKTVYFTFDDGPSQRTYEILETLAAEDIKATFFVVGATDEFSKQAMRDIVAQGHTIAMHTYSHQYKYIYNSVEDYLDDMYKIFTLIKETTGVTPTHFRFAGGSVNSYNLNIYKELISEMLRRGFIPFDWNVASGDASSTILPTAAIVNNVVSGTLKTSRAVVLMHDSYYRTTTARALPAIITTLKENGYSFDKLTPQTKPVLFAYN
ncbi:MAG: polysaccharide deacetylase [Oscillospiraceae bacterium]|nr:polysaccharide deacetylase [Oscillospiraceae bacterium]